MVQSRVFSGQQRQNGSSGGSAAPDAASGFSGTVGGGDGDTGLTAGVDALRLACLECLKVSGVCVCVCVAVNRPGGLVRAVCAPSTRWLCVRARARVRMCWVWVCRRMAAILAFRPS